jgi:S1-C subfamily serine protease
VLLTEVRPDGPADKAGLRPQDIIRKFSGERINFQTFAKKIIRIRPGTLVPIEVKRGEETVMLKLKIGVRPEDFPYPLPDLENKPDDSIPPPQLDDPKP